MCIRDSLFYIYIEVVRSTLLKILLSLPLGETGPFNESAWFEVGNWRFYQPRAKKTPKSRTYPLIILYQSVTIRPKWCTTLKVWGWTQEQNFHGIGVPGGRFFKFFKIRGVSTAQTLLGRFRGVRGNLVLASLLHLHWSGAKHSPENSFKSALRGNWVFQRVCMVRGINWRFYQRKARKMTKMRT